MSLINSMEKLVGFGLLVGFIIGFSMGAFTAVRMTSDTRNLERQKTAAIELRVRELDVERVELEKLIQAIEQFAGEVDEIILHVAKGKVRRIRFSDWPPEEK